MGEIFYFTFEINIIIISYLQEDLMGSFIILRKYEGWKENGGYAIRGNPRVLMRNSQRIAVVKPILIDRKKNIENHITKFFDSLKRILANNSIKDIFFPGGGTIPIPKDFIDFCKLKGITIHFITNDNFDKYVNWD